MSIRSVFVAVDCDRCDERATVEIVRVDEVALDQSLREIGWRQRTDLSDLCPNHPKDVQ